MSFLRLSVSRDSVESSGVTCAVQCSTCVTDVRRDDFRVWRNAWMSRTRREVVAVVGVLGGRGDDALAL